MIQAPALANLYTRKVVTCEVFQFFVQSQIKLACFFLAKKFSLS
jgi:hypothetical protein